MDPEARDNLNAIAEFIARDSPLYASVSVTRILERAKQAGAFPMSGRVVPEYRISELRELFWRDYRILYRVEHARVPILAVVHGSRMLENAMEKPP